MRADVGELLSEVTADAATHRALGTANWMPAVEASSRLAYSFKKPTAAIWLGENLNAAATPIGYDDDRHVCLVSGTRGGKGTGVIVPNLCLWPGSAVVIDPKGENATITLRRRGAGSDFARGMGQKVCLLDPFGEVELEGVPKARFNPLDTIDPDSDVATDDAARIAAAIVPRENKNDPYWEEAARNLIKGLILHVLSAKAFSKARNLVTVRLLLAEGYKEGVARVREQEARKRAREAADGLPKSEEPAKPLSPFTLLWAEMRRSTAFDGVVAGIGEQIFSMPDKMRSSVLEIARNNTEFIHGRPMQRVLEGSDFSLAELKTNPKGVTIYLVLPQRFMETHFRWLRLMTSLAVGEMERQKGRLMTGHRTLFLLDEFAGLKRMPVIENAVAQAAGFGVKFMFVLQNLAQLKAEYDDVWETFISNSGTRIFFQIDDHFTRDYLSKLLGEQEVRRETRSISEAQTASHSTTSGENNSVGRGSSSSHAENESIGRTYADWEMQGRNRGLNRGDTQGSNESDTAGTSFSKSGSVSASTTDGRGEGVHRRPLLHPDEIGRFLSRIDEKEHTAYPGLIACLLPGRQPLILRRVNYFRADAFAGLFDPHPQHPAPPTLLERAHRKIIHATSTKPPPAEPAKPAIAQIAKTAPVVSPLPRPAAPPPQITQPVTPVTELLKQLLEQTRPTQVLPPPRPPPIPYTPEVHTPVRSRKRFSVGSLLPTLMLGLAVLAGALWLSSNKAPFNLKLPSLSSAHSPAFNEGYAARQVWEKWIKGLSGPASDGAQFWAAERSLRSPRSCTDGAGASESYRNACLEAQRYLGPADLRRRRDTEYRAGWNSY